jgi:hypothetical protein
VVKEFSLGCYTKREVSADAGFIKITPLSLGKKVKLMYEIFKPKIYGQIKRNC